MILVLFLGALFFFIYPAIFNKRNSFVDLYILFCLYFDAMVVFTGTQAVNFKYYQNALFFIFSIFYFANYLKGDLKHFRNLFNLVFLFLLIVLVMPVLRGSSINGAIRDLSDNYSSMVILPISFHYYSTIGNISSLFKSGYIFIVSWVIIVGVFTIFRIDISDIYERMGSETFGLGIFYFGNMTVRGAITYIGFALLLVPLILTFLKKRQKSFLIGSSGFMLFIIFVALKRFTLVTLTLGLINYLIKTSISLKKKSSIVAGFLALLTVLFVFTDLQTYVYSAYEGGGADKKYSVDAMESDIRLFEPLYAFQYANSDLKDLLVGSESGHIIDIRSDRHFRSDRVIHNYYARLILEYGIFALFSYLLIFIFLYRLTSKLRVPVKTLKFDTNDYWIVFQNLVLIFIAAGMVGGHEHPTWRGLVMVFAGGISGYFYKLYKEQKFINS